ncbi:uncharacterized protein LOC128243952 [Mya arenaria]|uniref:uncharacterized protein LOC128243952 n=1 Tax=Mya arenaria TaxID=6604 RepID=UPI0022E15D93|nr:uncharacterized protein LOC128243952 [Mya arenaria]
MEKGAQKPRRPNFTQQDCLLLAQVMGEEHPGLKMSFNSVVKHRFTNGITSQTKKTCWKMIQAKFNASGSEQRDADHLEKKWDNLCALHRSIYADHQRSLAMTGMGPVPSKYSLITEAVMDVVGRSTASVVGAATMATDSTFNMLISQGTEVVTEVNHSPTASLAQARDSSSIEQPVFIVLAPALTPSQGPVKRKNCCCDCHTEV